MAHYIVSYDLRNQRNYQPLWGALQQAGGTRLLESLWLLNSSLGAGVLTAELVKLIDNDDGVAVIELQGSSSWAAMRAQAAGTNWLQQNIRAY
jgi:hypothetical protein